MMLSAEAPSLTLSEKEVIELADGYKQADKQLAALLAAGYTRARRSKLTGRVVLERAHAEAVAAGKRSTDEAQNDPQPNWGRRR